MITSILPTFLILSFSFVTPQVSLALLPEGKKPELKLFNPGYNPDILPFEKSPTPIHKLDRAAIYRPPVTAGPMNWWQRWLRWLKSGRPPTGGVKLGTLAPTSEDLRRLEETIKKAQVEKYTKDVIEALDSGQSLDAILRKLRQSPFVDPEMEGKIIEQAMRERYKRQKGR